MSWCEKKIGGHANTRNQKNDAQPYKLIKILFKFTSDNVDKRHDPQYYINKNPYLIYAHDYLLIFLNTTLGSLSECLRLTNVTFWVTFLSRKLILPKNAFFCHFNPIVLIIHLPVSVLEHQGDHPHHSPLSICSDISIHPGFDINCRHHNNWNNNRLGFYLKSSIIIVQKRIFSK